MEHWERKYLFSFFYKNIPNGRFEEVAGEGTSMPGRTLALPLSHAIKSLRRTTNAVPPPAKTEHKYTSVKNHKNDEFQKFFIKTKMSVTLVCYGQIFMSLLLAIFGFL